MMPPIGPRPTIARTAHPGLPSALNKPVVGMAATPNGAGYYLMAAYGGIFSFGVPFLGSMEGQVLSAPIVGITR